MMRSLLVLFGFNSVFALRGSSSSKEADGPEVQAIPLQEFKREEDAPFSIVIQPDVDSARAQRLWNHTHARPRKIKIDKMRKDTTIRELEAIIEKKKNDLFTKPKKIGVSKVKEDISIDELKAIIERQKRDWFTDVKSSPHELVYNGQHIQSGQDKNLKTLADYGIKKGSVIKMTFPVRLRIFQVVEIPKIFSPDQTIADVREVVQKLLKSIPPEFSTTPLLCNGRPLDDDQTIDHYQLENDDLITIDIHSSHFMQFKIFYKNYIDDNRTRTLDVRHDLTILQVKQLIHGKTGIPVENMRLDLGSRYLHDDRTLYENRVGKESTLTLNWRRKIEPRRESEEFEGSFSDFDSD